MCPNNPGVQEFVSKTVSELSQISELNGIHLDYIRFPDVILAKNLQLKYSIVQDKEYPEYDYCYCHYCRNEFKELTGGDILRSNNKYISAAVFPNWENVRQQWFKWDVDAVFPMLYHEYYDEDIEWIIDNILIGKKLLKNKTKLYSGLLVDMFDLEDLKTAIIKSINSNADGVSFFTYHSLEEYSKEISDVIHSLKSKP